MRYDITRLPSSRFAQQGVEGIDTLWVSTFLTKEQVEQDIEIVISNDYDIWFIHIESTDIDNQPLFWCSEIWLPSSIEKQFYDEKGFYMFRVSGYICPRNRVSEILNDVIKVDLDVSPNRLVYFFEKGMKSISKHAKNYDDGEVIYASQEETHE